MARQSIYQLIVSMAQRFPGLPYAFQDVTSAGGQEVLARLTEPPLPERRRQQLAMDVLGQIQALVAGQGDRGALRTACERVPLARYARETAARQRLLLDAGLLARESAYRLAMDLATGSTAASLVQLGVVLLGAFENDVSRQVVRTLGLHSTLTIYALEAAGSYVDPNAFYGDLARNTRGWGQVAALMAWTPLREEDRRWLLFTGIRNEVASDRAAALCLDKPDMAQALVDAAQTAEGFPALSYALALALCLRPLAEYEIALALTPPYVAQAAEQARTVLDLSALAAVDEGLSRARSWPAALRRSLRAQTERALEGQRWLGVMQQALARPEYPTPVLLRALRALGWLPNFADFLPLLERAPFDLAAAEFLLLEHPDAYAGPALPYLLKALPEGWLSQGPQLIDKHALTEEDAPDLWVAYLLRAQRAAGRFEEGFCLSCLSSRFQEARREALENLREHREAWSDAVPQALQRAQATEPAPALAQQMRRLLGEPAAPRAKERRYVAAGPYVPRPRPQDATLGDSRITGTFLRDLTQVQGRLSAGAPLCLVPEGETVAVATTEGYLLGYLPPAEARALSARLEAGEALYARLLTDDLAQGQPPIRLYGRSRRARNLIPFPGGLGR